MSIIDKITKKPAAKKSAKKETASAAPATRGEITPAKKATALSVLYRAAVTEKAAVMQSANKYIFLVDTSATKNQIKHAVETLHNVTVKAVHIVHVQGKRKRTGRRSDFKKAIVTVLAGQNIVMHEGV